MRKFQLAVAAMCVTFLSGAIMAQNAAGTGAPKVAAPTAAAKLPAILDQIPAGTMGYIVAGDLKAATDNVDRFISDIGMAPMAQAAMPDGLLEMMKTQMQLGEGFNPAGGFAVVMLDPAAFDVDLAGLLKKAIAHETVKDTGTPFVVYLPGKSLETILPSTKDMKKEAAGKFTKIELPIGSMFVAEFNGYVLISPNDKALTAVMESKNSAAKELNKQQLELITSSDVAIQVNIKNAQATFLKLADVLESIGEDDQARIMAPMAMQKIQIDRDELRQMQSFTVTARIAKDGLMLDVLATYLPDSVIGKAMATIKPAAKLLERLPNINYVLAVAGQTPPKDADTDLNKTKIDEAMKNIYGQDKAKEAAAMSAKISKLLESMRSECTGMQLVIGGAPEGSGLVGAALVLECKDAAKVKAALAEMTKIVQDIIKDAAPDEDVKQLGITYTPAKDSTGMDVIEITHPELLTMPDEQKKMLKSIVGEDVLRIQVASVDGAVILTFGGGSKFMEEALKVAKGGGTIPAEAGVKEVLKLMPQNLVGVAVFNPSNLLSLISKGAELVGQPDSMPPIKLNTQTPIAVGVGVTGSAQHVRVYVPSALIKEATSAIMGLMMGRMGGGQPVPMRPMPPQGGADNF